MGKQYLRQFSLKHGCINFLFGKRGIQFFQRTEFLDKHRCGFVPYPRHTFNIVRWIPLQPFKIGEALRFKPKAPAYGFFIIQNRIGNAFPHGKDNRAAAIHQLGGIHITRRDNNFEVFVFFPSARRKRTNYIVGFVSGFIINRNTERLKQCPYRIKLRNEVIRRGNTLGLVLFVRFVPKGGLGAIKRGRDIIRLKIFQDF